MRNNADLGKMVGAKKIGWRAKEGRAGAGGTRKMIEETAAH